jgi:replicative DNA helicase
LIIAEAEKRVLGAVIANNQILDLVVDLVRPDDFSVDAHRLLFGAQCTLREANQPITANTLADQLRGFRAQVTDDALRDLVAVSANRSEALADAGIVLRDSLRRQLVTLGTGLAVRANQPPEETQSPADYLAQLIANHESAIAELALRQERKPERPFADVAEDLLASVKRQEARGLATGFKSIDEYFGGYIAGHLSVLAARSSRGKTALAVNIARNNLKLLHPILFITLEMTYDSEMVERFIAAEGCVNFLKARSYGYQPDEEERAIEAAAHIAKWPLRIRYRPLLKPRELRLECRRAAQEIGPLKLVIVDYLGLMRGDRHENQRYVEIGNIVVQLKALAGEFGFPILLLAQINREAVRDGAEDSPPTLAQLRDTGTLEEHADDVSVLWHKPQHEQQSNSDWTAVQLIIRKQRNGPRDAQCELKFRQGWGRFEDGDEDWL